MSQPNTCVCGDLQSRRTFSAHFDALRCTHCDSSHFVPKAGTSPPEFRYDGDNGKYSQRDYLYGKQLRWAHTELLARNWFGRKVLEIGCFNGFFLDELRARGADVYGFDVNADALAVGQELYGLGDRLRSSLVELKQFGPYDDLLCIDVIEHLDEPEHFIAEVTALLKPQGQIFVAGPTIERGFHDKSDYPPHHKWWFSRQGLSKLLERNGYSVTQVKVQRDGLLLLRNFLGKAIHGLNRREFYGEAVAAAPSHTGPFASHIYAALSGMGRLLFGTLRISYCSSIVAATRNLRG